MPNVWKAVGLGVLSLAAVNLVQCSADDAAPEEQSEPSGVLPEVVYGGEASDEALERLWSRLDEAEPSTENGVALTSPANGAEIGVDASVRLEWQEALGDARGLPAPASQGSNHLRIRFGWPVAHAHQPPVSGWVYLVEIQGATGDPFRIFTTETSWQADDAAWSALLATGDSFDVRIYNAYLNQNVIEEGPYLSPSASHFTVVSP